MYDDEELEAIKRRKMAELQEQQTDAYARREQEEAIEAQKQQIMRQILTDEARERLNNIKLVRPQVAESIEIRLIQIAQQGTLRGKITDDQLKEILRRIQGEKRETKIDIRRL